MFVYLLLVLGDAFDAAAVALAPAMRPNNAPATSPEPLR